MGSTEIHLTFFDLMQMDILKLILQTAPFEYHDAFPGGKSELTQNMN